MLRFRVRSLTLLALTLLLVSSALAWVQSGSRFDHTVSLTVVVQ